MLYVAVGTGKASWGNLMGGRKLSEKKQRKIFRLHGKKWWQNLTPDRVLGPCQFTGKTITTINTGTALQGHMYVWFNTSQMEWVPQ